MKPKVGGRVGIVINSSNMVYRADLRCSYGRVEMNEAWIDECLRDIQVEWDFKDGSDCEAFYNKVDEWATDYVKLKVFWTGEPAKDVPADLKCAESLWDYISQKSLDYFYDHQDQMEIFIVDKEVIVYEDKEEKCEECGEGDNNNMKCSGTETQAVSFVCDNCVKK